MEVGTMFGRLTVLRLIPDKKNPKAECRCECGVIVTPQRGSLKNGRAQSCGCLRREKLLSATTTHGKSKSRAYKVWQNMNDRCGNPNNKQYADYGGRGIVVEWGSFEQFYADMGDPPNLMMIERKDNDGNYCKKNVVWADWDAQASNKRTSKRWVIHGVEYRTAKSAAVSLGVDTSVVHRRANGYTKNGRYYHPLPEYQCVSVYE